VRRDQPLPPSCSYNVFNLTGMVMCAVSPDSCLGLGTQKQPYIWNLQPLYIHSLFNFYSAPITINWRLIFCLLSLIQLHLVRIYSKHR